jgi:hypothetical protein
MIFGVSNEHTLDTTIGDLPGSFRFCFHCARFAPRAQVLREFGVLATKMFIAR